MASEPGHALTAPPGADAAGAHRPGFAAADDECGAAAPAPSAAARAAPALAGPQRATGLSPLPPVRTATARTAADPFPAGPERATGPGPLAPATTARTASEAPLCLSLTRLTRRLGRGPLTGIDRVERAWLGRLLEHGPPAFGLVRSGRGYLLLDRAGLQALALWADGAPLPPPEPPGLLHRLLGREARPVESALAALALARCSRPGLARMLRRHLPQGTHYLNTGHSDLRPRALAAWRGLPGARVAVLVHDTIPLDLPQSQRPGSVGGFRARMQAVAAHADLVIHVSAASRTATEAQLAALGRVPPGLVAHPGVSLAPPKPAALPPGLPDGPCFVVLGTIEPRKNHALLLDVWERLAEPGAAAPHLLVVGRRGWANEAVFRRLDALARPGTRVHELPGLSDGAVAALLLRARALLMPSLAEGYGLPVLEAAGRGLPVLASDLPVYRETLGELGVYLPPDDPYAWLTAIRELAQAPAGGRREDGGQEWLPTWQQHFAQVLDCSW